MQVLVEGSVDRRVYDELQVIYESERRSAAEKDQPEPSWSQVLELVLRKGVKAWKAANHDA